MYLRTVSTACAECDLFHSQTTHMLDHYAAAICDVTTGAIARSNGQPDSFPAAITNIKSPSVSTNMLDRQCTLLPANATINFTLPASAAGQKFNAFTLTTADGFSVLSGMAVFYLRNQVRACAMLEHAWLRYLHALGVVGALDPCAYYVRLQHALCTLSKPSIIIT